jgi:pyruvate dehydrogenase E1 component alpha subunit
VGAGFAIRYRREVGIKDEGSDPSHDIVFCMFGDGATNIGAFHESLNFSKVFDLPVVWYCVNNQYGMGTAVERASAVTDIYRRACAYDMESIRIDGNDVVDVVQKTHDFVQKTRRDSAPRFIEVVCFRHKGHSVIDPDKYRTEEEKREGMKGDPVLYFEHQLKDAKLINDTELKGIKDEVEKQVEETVSFADESPNPPIDELYKFLYAGQWGDTSSDGRADRTAQEAGTNPHG